MIVVETRERALRKINLPLSETDLLKGLDAHGAHADEVAEPSAYEMGNENICDTAIETP